MDPNTIILTPETTIDDLFDTYPDATIFNFQPGNYYINRVLHITKPNIRFIGTTSNAKDVHIFQNNSTMDGISINADNIIIRYISLHVPFDDKVALTVAGSNNTKIANNYFYGNATTFTVYYAGPKDLVAGKPTLDAYFNSLLDDKNIFKKNVIYSKWAGDNVSFSLQKNGIMTCNLIRGGKIAVYMCKDTYVTHNTIYDSSSNGVHLSLPSEHVHINCNKIYECTQSGIKFSNQLEHGSFQKYPYNIYIMNNYIYDSKINAIELNDAIKITINCNKLISCDQYGIYLLNCEKINIIDNKICYFDVSVWIEQSSSNLMVDNLFMSIYPDDSHNVVKITNASNDNIVLKNSVKGKIIYDLYPVSSDCLNNLVTLNNFDPYYTYDEEIDIMSPSCN